MVFVAFTVTTSCHSFPATFRISQYTLVMGPQPQYLYGYKVRTELGAVAEICEVIETESVGSDSFWRADQFSALLKLIILDLLRLAVNSKSETPLNNLKYQIINKYISNINKYHQIFRSIEVAFARWSPGRARLLSIALAQVHRGIHPFGGPYRARSRHCRRLVFISWWITSVPKTT